MVIVKNLYRNVGNNSKYLSQYGTRYYSVGILDFEVL